MTLVNVLKRFEKVAADNSPMILTGLGVVGVVTTAILTGKATFKAADILDRHMRIVDDAVSKQDKVRLVWMEYLPAVGSGAMAISAIICANRIGTRRAAAVAAAYGLSERAFAEYKDKVIERMGEKKERDIREEIAQDRVKRSETSVIIGSGKVLCCDLFCDRYFESTMESIKKAQNDTNYQILHHGYASLGDFYERLGLRGGPSFSEELGWTTDNPMEVVFTTVLTNDGQPCLALEFAVEPVRNYHKFG